MGSHEIEIMQPHDGKPLESDRLKCVNCVKH
jgi:hypothetical protein